MNNKLSLLVNFIGVDKMSGALKNIVGLGGKGSKSLRALTGDARKLTRDLQSVQREIAKGSGNVTQLVERERDLERQLTATNNQMQRQRRLAAIDADKQAMQRRGRDLRDKGAGNAAGSAAAAAPFLLAIKSGAEFSSIMVDIQQKAELSDAATQRMRQNIIMTARAAKLLPAEMASAVDTLSGLGLDPQQAVKAARPMGRFMTAFKAEGEAAAAALYSGFSNLKIPLAQSEKLFDMMAAGANKGAFEAKDMAAAFPGLTAQMAGLGQAGTKSAAELIAMLEVVRRGSGDSASAATNAENLLAKLTAPATINAFKKNFAIDLPAAIKRGAAAGISPLQTVIELTKKATGGDLSRLGFAFEDMQAQTAIRQLIIDQADFVKIQKEVAASSGLVNRAFDQRVANDQTVQLKDLAGAMAELALTASPLLLPLIRQVTTGLQSGVSAITAFANAHPVLTGYILEGAAALIMFKGGLGILQLAFGGLLGPLGTTIAFFRKVDGVSKFGTLITTTGGILKKAAPAFTMLRTAALFMGQGFLRAGAMMLANPIVLIITAMVVALGAAAYLVYTHWDKISGACKAGVAWVKGAIGGLPDWMRNIGSMMMQGLLLAINPMALGKKLIDMAKYGIQQFKAYLGIKSPSRVFMALGGHVAGGLERGIDGNRHGPARAAGRMAAGVAAAGALAMAAPATSARRPAATSTGTAPAAPITIQVYAAPGMDVKELAREVRRELDAAKGRQARSSYDDGS